MPVGIDLDIIPNSKNINHQFYIREKHMVKKIKEYINEDIVVVVGDSHLRTTRNSEIKRISEIYKEFKDNKKIKIIRSKYSEID